MSIYKPEHYTSSCIDSKNILSLCYKKYLGNNIISIIDSFLIEYATGFALFNNKNYIIDGKFIHKNNGGHALEPFIILLFKYCRNTNNKIFNQILENINNVKNNEKIDLTEFLDYIIQKNNMIIDRLDKPTNYIGLYIDFRKNIARFNIEDISVYFQKININGENRIIQRNGFTNIFINRYLDKKLNTLEEFLIEKSRFKSNKVIHKGLIINNDIISFTPNTKEM